MVKCYILASISNVLQHQIQDVELASDIMLSLKEMFGEQGHSARQETMRQIYNTKMVEGILVREHCLRMISNPNILEVLGADIDGESQVDIRVTTYLYIRMCTLFGLKGCLYIALLLLAVVAFIVVLVPFCNASGLSNVGFDEFPTF